MVAVAQWLRRQVVALKIEGSIPSSHPKLFKEEKHQVTIIKSHLSYVIVPVIIVKAENLLRLGLLIHVCL
jgi:hypothetical protein